MSWERPFDQPIPLPRQVVEVIGHKLATHHPVTEPVSAAEPGTEISDAETGTQKPACCRGNDCYKPVRSSFDCVEKLENRGLRKSRKCSALAISAAARLCRIDTSARDRFCGN